MDNPRSLRVAVAGISHETNTYCQSRTSTADFYQLRGERMLTVRGQHTDVGGAIDACDALGAIPVPILFASTQPSGTIDHTTYQEFKQEILDGLVDAGQIDAVVLCLHGAGVVDGIDDLEADLAIAVRELVGPTAPVTASFDLHGNITQNMADALDGIFACHHYPHIDMHERAAEAVALAIRMVNEGLTTAVHVTALPMLMPTTTTYLGPGQRHLEAMLEAENEPGVIDVSWFHGFPYTDVGHVGAAIAVTCEGDAEQARRVAQRCARALWDDRESLRPLSLSAEEAVSEAIALGESQQNFPIIINETSDNCGGGSPGDGTHLLRAMLEAGLKDACFGFVVDAEVAAQAHSAGVGATINVQLGGKTDSLHGEPLALQVYVKALHDGRITLQAMMKGAPLNLGPMARLVVDDMEIIVASKRSQTFDTEPFLALGIDVRRLKIVALKSSNHFRAGFQEIAAAIITADPPGLTTHHIEVFPRQKALHPLWPLQDFDFEP